VRPDDPMRAPAQVPPGTPPHPVRVAVNIQQWDDIAFLHWPVDRDVVQRLLPRGLQVDVYGGSAWIGVTPFFIRVRPLGVPVVPPGWAFPETNLRTYARGPDGRQGIWFLRMEVGARWFAAALRTIGLPYVRQQMAVQVDGDVARYRSRPDRPGERGGHEITVRAVGAPDATGDVELEQFLTARWHAYHVAAGRLLRTSVEHPPWNLLAGEVTSCDVRGLFAAADLPEPAQPPLVHISAGVSVRVGPPAPVRDGR